MAGRRTYRTSAIVLDRTKLAEQDLILTLLAASGAEVRAVAKGARKPGGRFASRVELFSETDFLLAKGRGALDIVSEASLVDAHQRIRGDFARLSAASAIAEVARLTCFQDSKDGFLYPICSRALAAVEQAADQEHLDLVVATYAFKVLAHAGWRPALDSCVACGDADVSYFSVRAGGVLCASCAKDVPGAEEMGPARRDWLCSLIGLTFDALLASGIDLETSTELVSLAHRWAATHLDARLRAFEFLLSI